MDAGDDFCVVGEWKMVASDDVDIALIEFAEASTLGAFAAVVAINLGSMKGEAEGLIVFDDVAGEGDGVIEAKGLVGKVFCFGGFVRFGGFARLGGFGEEVNLFLGVAAGFGEKNFSALNDWSLDVEKTISFVGVGDLSFQAIEDGLLGGEKLLSPRDRRGVEFHIG